MVVSDDVRQICYRLEKIEATLREQHDWQIRRDESDKANVKTIDDHQETLYGKDGLKPRVQKLEIEAAVKPKSAPESETKKCELPAWLTITLASVAASGIVGFIQWMLIIFKIH